jgi:hypothetical protein
VPSISHARRAADQLEILHGRASDDGDLIRAIVVAARSSSRTAFLVIDLPQVTLCCVDGIHPALALRALARCREGVQFARTLLFTEAIPSDVQVPSGIDVVSMGPIASHEAYSRVVMKGLFPHITTSHLLLVQWDGYVVHPEMWQPAFLDTDYLGATWPDGKGGFGVGNGGFSLRSQRLLAALQNDCFPLLTNSEDVTICGTHRPRLESDFGIQFGSPELARQFSFEMESAYVGAGAKTFGFLGIFNLCLVESQAEIAAIARQLPDSIARSVPISFLLHNLVKFEQWEAVTALGRRVLEANPENEDVAGAVVRARELLARQRELSARRVPGIFGRLAQRIRGWR